MKRNKIRSKSFYHFIYFHTVSFRIQIPTNYHILYDDKQNDLERILFLFIYFLTTANKIQIPTYCHIESGRPVVEVSRMQW